MPVEMVTRKIREHAEHGLIVYGYKFRPDVLRRAEVDGPPFEPQSVAQ